MTEMGLETDVMEETSEEASSKITDLDIQHTSNIISSQGIDFF